MSTAMGFRWVRGAMAAATASLVVACGGGGSSADPAPGVVRIGITDAPACGFDHVYVTVRGLRVHASAAADERSGGWTDIDISPGKRIDLLELTNGRMEELGQAPIGAGSYTQVRLLLQDGANSVVPTGGSETALATPSGMQTGIKVIRPFTVASDRIVDLVLDFDACRSIVQRGNGSYGLKPVVTGHLVDVAAITGTVDPAAGASITVQKGGVVIRSTVPTASGALSVPFLDPSRAPYDVVVTAAGRSTAVVAGVPLTLGRETPLGTIPMPAASATPANRSAAGVVGPAPARDTAEVRALQAVGTVPAVEVAFRNVDAVSGAYSLSLVLDAPRLATFGALPLGFAAQAGTAGQYTLQARASGFAPATAAADVRTTDVARDFTLLAVP